MPYKNYNLADDLIIEYEEVIKDRLARAVANYYLESSIKGGSISLPQLTASVECITEEYAVITFSFDIENFYKLDFSSRTLEEVDIKDPIGSEIIRGSARIKFITTSFEDYLGYELEDIEEYDVEYRPEYMRYKVWE